MSEKELVAFMWEEVGRIGNQKDAALQWRMSPQHLNDILNGSRKVSDNVAKKLGFRKVYSFEPRR